MGNTKKATGPDGATASDQGAIGPGRQGETKAPLKLNSARRKLSGRSVKSFSPTALESFRSCPKQFEFSYVLKTKAREAPTPQLVLGNAIHQTMAFLYRLPVEERGEEAAHRALRHFWAQIGDRGEAFFDEEEEIVWGERALAALSDYCASYDLAIRPVAVEEWIRARLPNGRIASGKADRVDRARGRDRGIEVVDYKTGKCRIDDDELHAVLAARLYALAASRTFRQPVVRVRFLYLVEGVERSWSPENEDLARIEDELVELTEEVTQTEVFVPRPDPFRCKWCKFRQLCPASDEASLEELVLAEEAPF